MSQCSACSAVSPRTSRDAISLPLQSSSCKAVKRRTFSAVSRLSLQNSVRNPINSRTSSEVSLLSRQYRPFKAVKACTSSEVSRLELQSSSVMSPLSTTFVPVAVRIVSSSLGNSVTVQPSTCTGEPSAVTAVTVISFSCGLIPSIAFPVPAVFTEFSAAAILAVNSPVKNNTVKNFFISVY